MCYLTAFVAVWLGGAYKPIIAGLDIRKSSSPDLRVAVLRNSGRPEFRLHAIMRVAKCRLAKRMDPRVTRLSG